jgi:ABC-type cobalamin transport system ATPase subunit
MALSTTDLAALDLAIASAELEVQLEGRRVKYRSTDELIKARAYVADLLSAGRTNRTSYQYNMTTSRGD